MLVVGEGSATTDMALWCKVVREFMTLKKASNSSKEMTPSPFVSMLRKMSSKLLAAITACSYRVTDSIEPPMAAWACIMYASLNVLSVLCII